MAIKKILTAALIGLVILYAIIYFTTPDHKIVYKTENYTLGIGFNGR
jgi:hypothetical protein